MSRWPTALALFAATLGLVAALGGPASARVYRNPEFGMRIPLPPGLRVCSGVPDDVNNYALGPFRPRDHGPEIRLDPKDKSSCEDDAPRTIRIMAFYNVVPEQTTLKGYFDFQCSAGAEEAPDGAYVNKCQPAPAGLGLRGVRTLSGRRNGADNEVSIVVVAQTGTTPHDQQAEGVDYAFWLDTTTAHLNEDLLTFRKFLNGVRIWRTTALEK